MSTFTHESMINHHGHGDFEPDRPRPSMSGGSATSRAANWPAGPSGTCTTSASPGATSPTRPKSRSGGLEWQPGRRRLDQGGAGRFLAPRERPHDHDAPRRSQAIFRRAARAERRGRDRALRRAARCRGAAELFPRADDALPLQPLPRRDQRAAAVAARGFHPYWRGRSVQRDRDHADRRPRDHRRRSALCLRQRHRQRSNSACRSTTAGRATASARR